MIILAALLAAATAATAASAVPAPLKAVSEVVQAMAAEAGFDMKIRVTEFATSLKQSELGEYQAFLIGWSGRTDPDGNIYIFAKTKGPQNVGGYSNPDVDKAAFGFDEYLEKGIYRCVEKALEQSQADHINTVGYCIGGTLMGAALAHMAARKDDRVSATTFFAAQHDFAEAGDLLLFTDEHWLNEVEQQMDAAGGVLPGAAMAETFNALRANDLIWSFFVSNYLMGKSPPAFDLLFWNADQTRMPKKLHLDYLRSMYGQNLLSKGEFTIGGVKVDLSKVTIPLYYQGHAYRAGTRIRITIAAALPQKIAFFCWCAGSERAAIAMTTALSPDRTMLARMIEPSAAQKALRPSKNTKVLT